MAKYPLTYNEFRQGLSEGKLLGLKCHACGTYNLPPNGVCTSCGSSDVEVNSFAKKGTIRTFIVIRVAPEGFDPPFIVAMVELEDGPWLVGNVIGVEPENADMELIGKDVAIGYKSLPPIEGEESAERIAFTFTTA